MSGLLCQSNYCRPEDFGGPRQVEPGRPLCRSCADRLGPTLRRIASMWPDLRARAAVEGSAGEKVTGTKIPGIVINEPVTDLSMAVQQWADAWARYVRRHHLRDVPPPKALRDGVTAGPILEWLAKYHAWRLAYNDEHWRAVNVCEWAEYYRREVRRLAYPTGVRRVYPRGAACVVPVLVRGDDGEPLTDDAGGLVMRPCGGPLYALIRPADDAAGSELVCDSDDTHRVPSKQWLNWARRGVRK
jgi:hypothetical protein